MGTTPNVKNRTLSFHCANLLLAESNGNRLVQFKLRGFGVV